MTVLPPTISLQSQPAQLWWISDSVGTAGLSAALRNELNWFDPITVSESSR